jgi:hypothetical protein
LAGLGAALAVAACGSSGPRQDAAEPKGNFPVAVAAASFPANQSLSEHTDLVIAVRNAGTKPLPDVAVTICDATCAAPPPAGQGSNAAPFGEELTQPYLANPSRPLWIVDRPPGACEYSCRRGGRGGAVTADGNTWALGRLAPGHTARFEWGLTAVVPGTHVIAWEVAAGLNGKARATVNGALPHGSFTVDVTQAPPQTYVNNNGQIVTQSQSP